MTTDVCCHAVAVDWSKIMSIIGHRPIMSVYLFYQIAAAQQRDPYVVLKFKSAVVKHMGVGEL